MSGLIHSYPVSLVIQANVGARHDVVQVEALQLAERLSCDVVFMLNGKAHVVQAREAMNGLVLDLESEI